LYYFDVLKTPPRTLLGPQINRYYLLQTANQPPYLDFLFLISIYMLYGEIKDNNL